MNTLSKRGTLARSNQKTALIRSFEPRNHCHRQVKQKAAVEKGSPSFRPLAATFECKGWVFRQLCRVGEFCLYSKSKRGATQPIQSWEIILPNRYPAQTLPSGSILPARETYPGDSQWGQTGWSFSNEGAARVAFAEKTKAQR
ncbi:MAG TPA: hypothetical protein VGL42_04090 [Opitutaceae bacterium]|jgi:hypothetical protein